MCRHLQRSDDRVQRVVHSFHDLAEIPLVFRRIRSCRQLSFHRRAREHVRIGNHGVDRFDAHVQVVLDVVEIAVVGIRDLGGNIAPADAVHILCRHLQWSDDRVQRVVHAFHDLAEIALVFRRVRSCRQFSFHRGAGKHPGIYDHGVHGVDAHVQVVLDVVEIAVVGIRDLGGNISTADTVHIIGCDVERPDDGVQRFVHSFHDLAEIALVFRRIRSCRQLSFHRGAGKHPGIGDHGVDRFDAHVQVVLDVIEIAVVGIRDLLRNISPADAIHVIRRHVQRSDHRVQCFVHPGDDVPVAALEL